ncbi:MAG: tetratricopeptide repeat protein [Bdellovibrio sp.]|nr:tetratricopeptide repeat protein [Bdellovibrio sp.]
MQYRYTIFLYLFFICQITYDFTWASNEFQVRSGSLQEQYERDVDEVALAAQESAIAKLHVLMKKYQNTEQESILLIKCAEAEQKKAALLFRIAHGLSHVNKKPLDLQSYRKAIEQSINTLTKFIKRFPNAADFSLTLYMRGKAYEEIRSISNATQDYLKLVNKFPGTSEALKAYMSLAEFAITANNHTLAIQYLLQIEKQPESSQYPFALYKLAWSHYNLKNISQALNYAEKNISYYQTKGVSHSSDQALLENMLQDVTLFYFDGYEQDVNKFSLQEAYHYFKKLNGEKVLGKMLLRFSKLLRSHGQEEDMIRFKEQMLLVEITRPETLDILLTIYEYFLNKMKYFYLAELAKNFYKIYEKQNTKGNQDFKKVHKILLLTAENLQKLIVKNKGAEDLTKYSALLVTIYDIFISLVNEGDMRVPDIHYNLAETLFQIQDYEPATTHYRWVVEHEKKISDADLKAIACRYEVLKKKEMLPKDLIAADMRKVKIQKQGVLFEEWLSWLEIYYNSSAYKKKKLKEKEFENFYFEANRALYDYGNVELAVKRFRSFAFEFPESTFSIPSASLVIDTYLASADWDSALKFSIDALPVKAWKNTEFSKRLLEVASDATFKKIENLYLSKNYTETLEQLDLFFKRFSDSSRMADGLDLAAKIALNLNEKEKAQEYFTKMIIKYPQTDRGKSSFLTRAELRLEQFQFGDSLRDYQEYFSRFYKNSFQKNKELDLLRRKILLLGWLSLNPNDLKFILEQKNICVEHLAVECDQYRALYFLKNKNLSESSIQFAFEKSRKAENKALWALVAMQDLKEFGFRDRLLLIRLLSANFDSLDPIYQYSVISELNDLIPKAFELNRMMMREVAPLRINEKYITRRIEVIHEMENAVTLVMKLPWQRIRALALNELSWLYLDFVSEMKSLKLPKDLSENELKEIEEQFRKFTIPFEERGQEFRRKAFELASGAVIENKYLKQIVEPLFRDNPSQASRVSSGGYVINALPLNYDLFKQFQNKMPPNTQGDSLREYFSVVFTQALKSRQWPKIAYLLQQMQEKSFYAPDEIGLFKTIALAEVGAQSEALVELKKTQEKMSTQDKFSVNIILLSYYLNSYAMSAAQEVYHSLSSIKPENKKPFFTQEQQVIYDTVKLIFCKKQG